ncbi:flagellar hook-associated protein FlgK [Bradyrhizobium sp. i1.4.4]
MGLSSALASAMSGLRANQAALSIVSSNVANSQTPGYVVQRPNQIEVTTGDFGSTAMTTGVMPGARHLCAEPAAHRDRRQRLRRPDG